ncbi:hypothetical protein E3J79_03385 [Candidatus Dependentiae bacterium]|nr:MAG: hypothetical protein E3J79_03385 [Candidatus Dependentiae bacterium]
MRIIPVKLFVLTSICIIICITRNTSLVGKPKNNQPNQPTVEKSLLAEKTKRTLKLGEEFTIELPSNPTTGYCWFMLVNQSPKERWIELVKSEYVPDQPILIGRGGKEKLTFKAMRTTGSVSREFYLYYCGPGGKTAEIKENKKVIPIFIKRK